MKHELPADRMPVVRDHPPVEHRGTVGDRRRRCEPDGGSLQGDLAIVTVTQTFVNPTATPLNAKYLFPLHKDAAVFAMTMEVGDEVVQARVREREEARQAFEQGKRDGKAAALLEQHRPNMFTQEIANLMPGDPIKVTLVMPVRVVPKSVAIDGTVMKSEKELPRKMRSPEGNN